jgi:hypothetical protein
MAVHLLEGHVLWLQIFNDLLMSPLYWWYATNVFLICQKANHGPLPCCLAYAIHFEYPNPRGIKYVGFMENDKVESIVIGKILVVHTYSILVFLL